MDPSVSLDGKMLCLHRARQGGPERLVRPSRRRRQSGPHHQRSRREVAPRFSPDGDRLAFTRREAQNIPRDSHRAVARRRYHRRDPSGSGCRWSPNGRQLAYLQPTVRRHAAGRLERRRIESRACCSDRQQFPFLREPAWSPDGQEIAIVRGSGGIAGEIWLIPTPGGDAAPRDGRIRRKCSLTRRYTQRTVLASCTRPTVAARRTSGSTRDAAARPSGSRRDPGRTCRRPSRPTARSRSSTRGGATRSTCTACAARRLDGVRKPRVLTSHSPYMWGPSFSRDGRTIAFSRSEVDGSWHIWSIPADGGTPKRITRHPERRSVFALHA